MKIEINGETFDFSNDHGYEDNGGIEQSFNEIGFSEKNNPVRLERTFDFITFHNSPREGRSPAGSSMNARVNLYVDSSGHKKLVLLVV